MTLINDVPFILHIDKESLLEQLSHIVNQRINQTYHHHRVYDIHLNFRVDLLDDVFFSVGRLTFIIDTSWQKVPLKKIAHIVVET